MNPWTNIPTEPEFVLAIDEPEIAAFNRSARPEHTIHTTLVPEPFLGSPEAPVVLLNLNPGFSEDDILLHDLPAFRRAALDNLRHEHLACPFYLLDPDLPISPGRQWWERKLRPLIGAAGWRNVVSRLLVLELHGYHSRRFSRRLTVPSQAYTRQLLRAAIDRDARIVVMRGRRLWEASVPELVEAAFVVQVRSVQNPVISETNLSHARFTDVVKALAA